MKTSQTKPRKPKRGYREEQPTDAGKTLNKLPEKIPARKRVAVKGKHGSGTQQGPAQELPRLVKRAR